jgi:mannose-1-phosphate guanylyltransferase
MSGGEGKRFRPLTYYFQKCMIPVGSSQRPLLEYVIRLLAYNKIRDVTLLVGYKYEQVTNYFNGGKRFGVKLNYLLDEPGTKGSGAALVNAYKKGLISSDETLLIYYGDILSTVDLTALLRQHREERAVATLVTSYGYQVPVGVAETEGKRIVRWSEKPFLPLNVGIGMMALESSVLADLARLTEKSETDIMGDLVPYLLSGGERVGCYVTDAFWYDVGSVERYERIDNNLIEEKFRHLFLKEETVQVS